MHFYFLLLAWFYKGNVLQWHALMVHLCAHVMSVTYYSKIAFFVAFSAVCILNRTIMFSMASATSLKFPLTCIFSLVLFVTEVTSSLSLFFFSLGSSSVCSWHWCLWATLFSWAPLIACSLIVMVWEGAVGCIGVLCVFASFVFPSSFLPSPAPVYRLWDMWACQLSQHQRGG